MARRIKTRIITPVLPDDHRISREGLRALDQTLTPCKREMLQLAAQSCSDTEIAERLTLGARTLNPPLRVAREVKVTRANRTEWYLPQEEWHLEADQR